MTAAFVNATDRSCLRRASRVVLGVALLASLAGCEPMGPIPGKRIEGEPTQVPADWRQLDGAEVVQLETAGNYSVNLWGVGIDEGYFIAASRGPETRWAERISRDAAVRLRVGRLIYDLEATPVSDQTVLRKVAEAFKSKYDFEARDDFPDAVVFRLGRR